MNNKIDVVQWISDIIHAADLSFVSHEEIGRFGVLVNILAGEDEVLEVVHSGDGQNCSDKLGWETLDTHDVVKCCRGIAAGSYIVYLRCIDFISDPILNEGKEKRARVVPCGNHSSESSTCPMYSERDYVSM